MRMPRLAARLVVPLAAAAAFVFAGTLASAAGLDARMPLGGSTTGAVPDGGGSYVVGVLLAKGTTKGALQVKASKGSTLAPRVAVTYPDGTVQDQDDFAAAGAKVKASTKGVNIGNMPEMTQSGLYKVVVTGADASSGGFSLKFKGKPLTSLKLPAENIANSFDTDEFDLAVPENAFLTMKVKAAKFTPFAPNLTILTPSGTELPYAAYSKRGKDDSLSVKNMPLPFFGDHVLRISSQQGSGDYSVIVKVKAKKAGAPPVGVPVADAGGSQVVEPNATALLDGSGSTGATTYLWTQVSGPPVLLSSAVGSGPSFTAPAAKATLAFQLVASNAGGSSLADVAVVEVDRTPVADGGPASSVSVGTEVTLDGTGSYDLDQEDTLTWEWTQVSGPAASLSSAFASSATFTPTVAGTYLFDLRVSDGTAVSQPDRVVVVAGGGAPAADAGRPVRTRLMDSVFLSGLRSRSAAGGAPAAWQWTRVDSEPVIVDLAGADRPVASFTAPKQAARLRFRLTVDGNATTADEVLVVVSPTTPVNASPVARAGAAQSVATGGAFTLDGSGSGDDGTIQSFEWLQVAGAPPTDFGDPADASPGGTAPGAETRLHYMLMVHDGSKYGSPDATTVTVGTAAAPLASAGTDLSGNPNSTLILSGAASTPTPGESILGYQWTQVSGKDWYDVDVSDSGFDPTAVSPAIVVPNTVSSLAANRPLLFALVVNDGTGLSREDFVTVNFTNLPTNAQPQVGASASATVIRPGSPSTLMAAASDGDGDLLSYQWAQISGPPVAIANANTANATINGPNSSGDMVFRVTVNDGTGEGNATAIAQTTVTANRPPTVVVSATPATGPQDTEVTLDGSQSFDPDEVGLSYLWTELPPAVGNPVSLSGASTSIASFVMPAYTGSVSQRTRRFRLRVTDSMGTAFAATADVTFIPNQGPTLNAIIPAGDRKFRYNNSDSETMSASPTSDADGDSLTFTWRIVSGPSTSSGLLSGTSGTSVSIRVPAPTPTSPNTGGVYTVGVTASDGAVLSNEVTLKVLAMPSFGSDVYPILSGSTCSSGCHSSAASGGGMVLTGSASTVIANLVGVNGTSFHGGVRVTKNNSSASTLYTLTNNGTMPQTGNLSAGQIAMIRDWIEPEYAETNKPGITQGCENN